MMPNSNRKIQDNPDGKVSSMGLFNTDGTTWNWTINSTTTLRGRSAQERSTLLEALSNIKPTPSLSDTLNWYFNADCNFSVSSAYSAINAKPSILPLSLVDAIWFKGSPPRVQVFTWKLAHLAIPTKWNILSKGILPLNFDPLCSLCNIDLEDANHLFIHCPSVRMLWSIFLQWWKVPFVLPASIPSLLQQVQFVTTNKGINRLFHLSSICLLWSVWFGRNNLQFKEINWDQHNLLSFIQSRSYAWIRSSHDRIFFTASDWFQFPMVVSTNF